MGGRKSVKSLALLVLAAINLISQGVAYTVDTDGLTSLTYNGGSNLSDPVVDIGNGTCVSWDAGSCTGGGSFGAKSFSNAGPVFVQQTYTDATSNFTWKVTYTGSGTNTLTQTILLTNNSATLTCRPQFDLIGMNFGIEPTFSGTASGAAWPGSTPMAKAVFNSVAMYYWYTPLSSPISMAFESYGTNKYRLTMQTIQTVAYGDGSESLRVSIAPLGSLTVVLNFRFGTTSETDITFVPEAYSNYADFAPYAVPWIDRRPVARFIMSNVAAHSAPSNPRGWTFGTDPIGDPTQFRTAALAKVDDVIALADSQNPRPSTILIWDIEGQEFDHAFSYVGYPSRLAIMAPEMDTIADELIARIMAAGYAVGLTIRPNTFQYGTSLPGSCTSNANSEFADIYVKTDASPPNRGYLCTNGPGTCAGVSVGNWCQEGDWKPGSQHTPDNSADIQAALLEKIGYSLTRWGVKFFYMDSNGVAWRTIYAAVNAAYPDVVILPEHRSSANYAFMSAYSGDQPNQEWGTQPNISAVWPKAGIVVVPYTEQVLNDNMANYIVGVAGGSSGLYDSTSGAYWAVTGITSAFQSAQTLNAIVAMTDRGNPRVFKSAPGTSFTYPLTARVYFADTTNNLAASTTYCTRMATDACYLSGVLQSTAALNLATLPYYQLAYYDFAGNLVSRGPSAQLQ